MVSRMSGAIIRAFLVILLVIAPTFVLPQSNSDTGQMVALAAIFAGLLTFVEYQATYPSLVEFRDAAPFNRLRFGMLSTTVFLVTVSEMSLLQSSAFFDLINVIGTLIGSSMDFPYSPVRLAVLTLAEGGPEGQHDRLRAAMGLAYFASLVWLAVFVFTLRFGGWPQRGRPFNVWVNLPMFDPSTATDVVARLDRDGRINVALGFLLPFVTPLIITMGFQGLNPSTLISPHSVVWTITAWSFLPASLFLRGLALMRIADMLRDMRRARTQGEESRMATA